MPVLEGKVALITGAARGIGRAIAEKFAAAGSDLALCDVKEEWLADTAKVVADKGRKAACFAVDVSKAVEVQTAVDAALKTLGKIDVLVNNAGITRDGFLVRMSEADWDAVLAVNLKGTFLFTKAVAKLMMKQL